MKTIVMMIGEFEYEGIFENFPEDYDPTCNDDPDCAEWNSINFTSKVSYVIFCSFIIVVTIVISNILVGLAVDDIKGVQERWEKLFIMFFKIMCLVRFCNDKRWRSAWRFLRNTNYLTAIDSRYSTTTENMLWKLEAKTRSYSAGTRDLWNGSIVIRELQDTR